MSAGQCSLPQPRGFDTAEREASKKDTGYGIRLSQKQDARKHLEPALYVTTQGNACAIDVFEAWCDDFGTRHFSCSLRDQRILDQPERFDLQLVRFSNFMNHALAAFASPHQNISNQHCSRMRQPEQSFDTILTTQVAHLDVPVKLRLVS